MDYLESVSTLSLNNSESSCNSSLEVELSSCEKVLLDEDLLTLILLRIPIRKLICFASVSKIWHSLITSPRFSLLRSNTNANFPLRPSALFFQINVCKDGVPNFISFAPLDNANHTTCPFRESPFNYARDPCGSKIRIMNSCAGLLLCSSCHYSVLKSMCRYYIYNPTTNQLLTLPKNHHFNRHFFAALAFDPSKSPHYRVFICATPTTPSPDLIRFQFMGMTYPIQKQFYIYSSETGTWRPSGQPFISIRDDYEFTNSVYCNGCVHWITETNSATDTEVDNTCYYFNLDQERLETMPRPSIGLWSSPKVTSFMGVSQNHLHLVEVYACNNMLNVYEMESNYSGWFLKYKVDLSPISQVFPEMMKTPDQVYVLSLVRRENFEEDSFLVMHIPGKPRKAIHYNLVNKSFNEIWDFSYPKYLSTQRAWVRNSKVPWPKFIRPRKFQAFEFIESLSRV